MNLEATDTLALAAFEEALLWQFLHHLHRAPDDRQWQWLQRPETAKTWQILNVTLELALAEELPLPPSLAAYQDDHLHTFEVGAPAPPCPLVEHHWIPHRPASVVLAENARFFSHFGLKPSGSSGETADQLRFQLEFMAHLCNMASRLYGEDSTELAGQALTASRDYLTLHLLSWLPTAAESLNQSFPKAWYSVWMTGTARAAQALAA